MRVGIVLLPDNETAVKAKEASAALNKKFTCFFKLDSTHIPHATLLHADISDEDLENILACVENIANSSATISVMPLDLRRGFMAKTLIGVYFKDNSEILSLRQKVLDKVSKYLLKTPILLTPHVTITRIKRDEDVDVAMSEIKSLLNCKFVLPAIGICKIGENGACASVIKSFVLKDNIQDFSQNGL